MPGGTQGGESEGGRTRSLTASEKSAQRVITVLRSKNIAPESSYDRVVYGNIVSSEPSKYPYERQDYKWTPDNFQVLRTRVVEFVWNSEDFLSVKINLERQFLVDKKDLKKEDDLVGGGAWEVTKIEVMRHEQVLITFHCPNEVPILEGLYGRNR